MVNKDNIKERLKEVKDPELGIDIVTLGLVYDIILDDEGAVVTMTLTTPFCPFADELIALVEEKVVEVLADETKSARVELTFDPPWEPSEELRTLLGV